MSMTPEDFGIESKTYVIMNSRVARWTFQGVIERELRRLGLGEEEEDYQITYFWGRFDLITPKGLVTLMVEDIWNLCSYREGYKGSVPAKWNKLFAYLEKIPDREIKFRK